MGAGGKVRPEDQRRNGGGREGQCFHMIVIVVVVLAVDSHSTATTTSKNTSALTQRVHMTRSYSNPCNTSNTEGGTAKPQLREHHPEQWRIDQKEDKTLQNAPSSV